ncbi:hypothetical protein BCR32DRAFT_244759 [Anaeromyces robustus]|jgi:hypothetical protein|uniref:Uncharacterized protein n=1 Tax=Anaeromyces robustus TaxID=1754192 RepID=A0A1Y1X782_9FUNG|nr:hypothetical protein BCR32DRAFT_244759 [Anaeromyces robustus]|eukprot:ORX81643.1 hypothetical protein BCR32DRAFT_244759 [Anaeromyces robustus]
MTVEVNNNTEQQASIENNVPEKIEKTKEVEQQTTTTQNPPDTSSSRKVKKSSKRRANDVKHVSRKLIMAWKLASEQQNITWKEIAPIIDSVEYISSHWKTDERLKSIEPVAVEIVSQVNKIHLELNLRVFGMNRLRIITEEFLNLLQQERTAFLEEINAKKNKTTTEENTNQDSTTIPPPSPSTLTDNSNIDINTINLKAESTTEKESEKVKKSEKNNRSQEELLDRLINSLIQLDELLNEPNENTPISSTTGSPKPSNAYLTPPQKHKPKKRNLFSGFFGSSQKQSVSTSSSNSSLNNSETSSNSSNNNNHGLEVYKNNIVSEWQEYTRKFVEPNYLFKVCKCYLAANPSAIPLRASLIGQNWICVANEISLSLWNILKKREDDLASSLIFLTLYRHGSPEVIERAINTIGSQLPEHFYVRLEYALKIKEYDDFTKEEQLMLDSNYQIPDDTKVPSQPPSPTTSSMHKKSNSDFDGKRNGSTSKKDKKKKHTSYSTKSESSDEQLSFADMLAM